MLNEFGGANDSEALFNFVDFEGRRLQVRLQLIDEDEDDFTTWHRTPEFLMTDDGFSEIEK